MKKVLHIPNYFPPHLGGVEQVASDIVDSLKGRFEQVVFAFNHTNKDCKECNDGVTIYRCGTQFKVSSQAIALGYGKKLKKVLTEYKPDIIHFHYPNPFAAHFLLKYAPSARLIVHYHSDIIKQKILKTFFVRQTKELLKRADQIVATSPQYIQKSEFLPMFKDKCILIPNCINNDRLLLTEENLEESKEIRAAHDGKIICLFVGRHVPYKGLTYLIKAADYLGDNIILRIAGEGKLTKSLKKQANNKSNIEFIGAVPHLSSEMYACDIFTFPSITKNEAFGIALAEAMWFHKPAVTFHIDGSGVNYVGVKDLTCLECDNCDVVQLAGAINRLASDEELREFLGNNAYERVNELFLFNTFKNNILKLYGE